VTTIERKIIIIIMLNIFVVFFMVLGVTGLVIGLYSFKQYTGIVNSVEPISIFRVLKISAWMGVSGCFTFFALITLLGTIIEKKLNWPFHEVVGLLVISVIVGAIVFFGSTYQIYTTIKYRDLLINKKIIKKD